MKQWLVSCWLHVTNHFLYYIILLPRNPHIHALLMIKLAALKLWNAVPTYWTTTSYCLSHQTDHAHGDTEVLQKVSDLESINKFDIQELQKKDNKYFFKIEYTLGGKNWNY